MALRKAETLDDSIIEGFREAAFEDAAQSDPTLANVRDLRGADRDMVRDAWWVMAVVKQPDLLTLASEGKLPPKISYMPRPKLPALPPMSAKDRALREYLHQCHGHGISPKETGERVWIADFSAEDQAVGVYVERIENILLSIRIRDQQRRGRSVQPELNLTGVLHYVGQDDPPVEAMQSALRTKDSSDFLPDSLVPNYMHKWDYNEHTKEARLMNQDMGVFGFKSPGFRIVRLGSEFEAPLDFIWELYVECLLLRNQGGSDRDIREHVKLRRKDRFGPFGWRGFPRREAWNV